MGIKSWLISKLERDVESTAGYVNLENLSDEERNSMFAQFGEGDSNLENFLRKAYDSGLPSMHCCCGHGEKKPYVALKITDENLEIARRLGKILSNYGITTNFEEHHILGKRVSYMPIDRYDTEWMMMAANILEHPEKYEDEEPSIYYHETMYESYKPMFFDLKRRLLNNLRGTKQLPEGKEEQKLKDNSKEKFRDSLKVEDKNERPEHENDKHKPINKMISYGFAGSCVHLHLPVDLKEDLSTIGIKQTMDKVNLYLVDAIEKINELKKSGDENFKNKNSIYMISPALIKTELKTLEEFGFTTKFFFKSELANPNFVKEDREAQLATRIFGPYKNVGTANLEFKEIDSEKFKQAKTALVERCKKAGITIEKPEEDKDR